VSFFLYSFGIGLPDSCFVGVLKDLATAGSSFPYSFSKSAVGLGTAALAHELLPLGIRVNGIAPGLFPTEVRHAFTLQKGIIFFFFNDVTVR